MLNLDDTVAVTQNFVSLTVVVQGDLAYKKQRPARTLREDVVCIKACPLAEDALPIQTGYGDSSPGLGS